MEESKIYKIEQKEPTSPSSSTNKMKIFFFFLSLNDTKEAQVALRALELRLLYRDDNYRGLNLGFNLIGFCLQDPVLFIPIWFQNSLLPCKVDVPEDYLLPTELSLY